jgi:uncharacterized Zn-binding protein involved in type VI secretion
VPASHYDGYQEEDTMSQPAARGNDPVTGSDTHLCLVPSASGSVPTLIPGHVFSGTLKSGLSSGVTIDGLPAATVDSVAVNDPPHTPVPPGTSFVRTPSNRGTVSRGSTSVTIDGKAAARSGDPVRSCNDPADADTSAISSGSPGVSIG